MPLNELFLFVFMVLINLLGVRDNSRKSSLNVDTIWQSYVGLGMTCQDLNP